MRYFIFIFFKLILKKNFFFFLTFIKLCIGHEPPLLTFIYLFKEKKFFFILYKLKFIYIYKYLYL